MVVLRLFYLGFILSLIFCDIATNLGDLSAFYFLYRAPFCFLSCPFLFCIMPLFS